MTHRPLVLDFKQIDKHDIPLVGGKGANLGEMTGAGFPVPGGFVVTVESYDRFLEENNLKEQILADLKTLDTNNAEELQRVAERIQRLLLKSKVPEIVAEEIIKSYKKFKTTPFKKQLVAVRSSATAEDLPGASFAGQQATFLNVSGESNLIESVKECWASLFSARAIFYRKENKISEEKVKIAVVVQKMINSETSGVMFSIDPVKGDKEKIIIESVWGLGELIVQGSVIPDTYQVQKDTYAILSKEISDQHIMLTRKGERNIEKEVDKRIRDKQKISNDEIVTLAKLAQKLQDHYYFPQDIEWAKEGKSLYIIQTRPITTIQKIKSAYTNDCIDLKTSTSPILQGISASPGIATGKVKILKSIGDLKKIEKGDILVAKMTSPDYVPAMKKAAAIITDEGGMTSHAAIVSRELGVPCIVGTREATKKLKDNFMVTVDAKTGVVYLGSVSVKQESTEVVKKNQPKVKTATRIYVNLAEVELAKKTSLRNVDGVGLLRAEFMIANIGIHPKEAIKQKKQQQFIDKLADQISVFCESFGSRPVVYRATDFKTNEYRSLEGGKFWEPEESNPMLGFRGAARYIAQPEVFNLELEAIKKVREKHKNLWLMIPFVRSPEELRKVRRIIASADLFNNTTFKLWMMVEIPVNVIQLNDFIDVGIDGVSIGSNDLTMLLLGTDRDNCEVAQNFDERSKSVLWALKRIIKTCNKRGITSSICGQAPSSYEDLVAKLIKYGITSMSVNPDAIERVRSVVAGIEEEILK